jgi:hypothetical protein
VGCLTPPEKKKKKTDPEDDRKVLERTWDPLMYQDPLNFFI